MPSSPTAERPAAPCRIPPRKPGLPRSVEGEESALPCWHNETSSQRNWRSVRAVDDCGEPALALYGWLRAKSDEPLQTVNVLKPGDAPRPGTGAQCPASSRG